MERLLRGDVMSARCPARQILQHLTNRWGGLVLLSLKSGNKGYGELKRQIEGISERMLTQTLQQLEGDKMISRHALGGNPPRVEYRLTKWGSQATEKIAVLVDWLEENLPEILAEEDS